MAEFMKKGLSNDNPHVSEFFSGVEIELRNIASWARNNKNNPVISARMPKSSDHGWQALNYDGL